MNKMILALVAGTALVFSAPASHSQTYGTDQLHAAVEIARLDGLTNPSNVRTVQTILRAHGLYAGAVDGIVGPLTLAGLQRAQGMTAYQVVPIVRMNVRYVVPSPGPVRVAVIPPLNYVHVPHVAVSQYSPDGHGYTVVLSPQFRNVPVIFYD